MVVYLTVFPRTIRRLRQWWMRAIAIDHVLEITVSDEEIIKRLSGRRVHPGSGRIYHVDYSPPLRPDVDDESGEPLVQREDDHEDTVKKRLNVYHEQTRPLVNFYRALDAVQYHQLDGVGAVDDITRHIMGVLR
jgi:adenylate kinase